MALHSPAGDNRMPVADFVLGNIFIGRAQQLALFEFYLDQWKVLMAGSPVQNDAQVTASPSLNNKIQGLVALLYGRGGFGKSTLLKHYREIALQPGRNLTVGKIVDWEFVVEGNRNTFNPPPGQEVDADGYYRVLCEQLAEALGKKIDHFKEFKSAVAAVENARKQVDGVLENMRKDDRYDWLLKVASQEVVALVRAAVPVANLVPGINIVAGGAEQGLELTMKYGADQARQLYEKLHDHLGHAKLNDYLAPAVKLGLSLGSDLARFAKDYPLFICFDTYEMVDEGDGLLRMVMGAAGARVGWVLAGRDNLWAGKEQRERSLKRVYGYKDIVLSDRGFAIDFNVGGVGAFTVKDIIDYFALLCKNVPGLPAMVTEEEAERILDVTQGVPLAVKIAAGLYLETASLDIVTEKADGQREIVDLMVQRYLQHAQDDQAERARLYGLALLRRADQPAAIAAALGLSPEQAETGYKPELSRLHRRYSFIFTEKAQTLLHQEVRYFLRLWLLEHRRDPEINAVNERLRQAHVTALKSLEEHRQYSNLRERLEDDEWVGVYLDLVEQQFWLDPAEGVRYCLPFMLAAAIYRRNTNQEAATAGNFFANELKQPASNWWKWAAQSLIYLSSTNPSPEESAGLEELTRLASQHCPTLPLSLPDYRAELEAALWWRSGEAYDGRDNLAALKWYREALTRLDQEDALRRATAATCYQIASRLFDEKKYAESLPYLKESIELNDDDITVLNVRGVVYRNLKEYELAIKDYSRAIELDSTYAHAYNNRGNAYYHLKQYEQAIKDYDRALELDPNYAFAYTNRGLARSSLKQYEQAIKDYDRALQIDANYIDAYLNRGFAYQKLKDYERAIKEYNRVIELDPKHARAYYDRGNAYADLKDYDHARENYDRSIELDPSYANAYNARGNLYYDRKDYERAMRDYDRAIEQDPKYIYAYHNRGLVHSSLQEYKQALQEYDRAIELDSTYIDAYNNRGLTYQNLKDYERAIKDYDRAIELDPTLAYSYNSRGSVYLDLKDYEQALRDCDRAIEQDADDVYAHYNRGMAHHNLKQYDEALKDFSRAIELDANHADAYNSRGNTYYALKDYERAIMDFDRAIALAPQSAYAYNNRGLAQRDRKQYRQSLQDFDRAIELDPKPSYVYNNRGLAYYYLQDYEQALRDFEEAIRLDSSYAAAYSSLGVTHLRLNDVEQAKADYKRSSELEPTDVNASWMAVWVRLGKERAGVKIAEQLEKIAEIDPGFYAALVCKGVALGLRGELDAGLAKFEEAIPLDPEEWDAYFWKGMNRAYRGRNLAASDAIDKALELELPPILLTPLYWLERDRADFFREYAAPLLAKYGV